MRGDFCHNNILIGRLQQVAAECGATTAMEYPIRINGQAHYIDLVITHPDQMTVCEAEITAARVGNDLEKAAAIGSKRLLIVTPDAPTAQACRRKLRRLQQPQKNLEVFVCPLGAAVEILRALLTERRPIKNTINQPTQIAKTEELS